MHISSLSPFEDHQHGPDTLGRLERSRPAEAQGTEVSKKRVREEPAEAEAVDENQFGKSPKQAKVKKALIVSGGLCGFKARHETLADGSCADMPLRQP